MSERTHNWVIVDSFHSLTLLSVTLACTSCEEKRYISFNPNEIIYADTYLGSFSKKKVSVSIPEEEKNNECTN